MLARRLGEIFGDDESPAEPRPIVDRSDERIIPHPADVVAEPGPELPREVGERIGDLIRSGDLEGAAELGGLVLDSLGVDRNGIPSGIRPGQERGL